MSLNDFRYSARALIKNPAFSSLAILTIALGIGANTSIFTAINGVLLKSFSFPEAERLVVVSGVSKSLPDMEVSYLDYLDWRAQQRVFVDLAARTSAGGVISGIGEPERVFGRYVTASFFSTLRVQPQIGRFFGEDEDKVGAARVMVIGDGLWRRRFNADPAVIGRAINYNGASWTVVGVLPANFDFYGRSNGNNDIFLPISQLALIDQTFLRDRGSHGCRVIARLRPGVTEREAAMGMNRIAARLAAQYPVTNAGVTVEVRSLMRDFVGEDSKALLVTSTGAILVLLIACANVANLTLARASTRQREIAVRLAVGGSRWQIVRLLLSESLLIALIGGTLGVVLAFWAVEAFKAIGVGVIARIDEIGVDVQVLIFSAGTIFIPTLLFGLLPAWKAAHVNVEPALKSGGRSGGLARVRSTLIVGELTLALMLLISASLLVKSFWTLTNVNPGFDPAHMLTFRMRLPDSKYDNADIAIRAVRELRQRISELPGVARVGITSGIPLGRDNPEGYWLEGQPEPANPVQWPVALSLFVDEGCCRALGVPLLAGRMLTERDTLDSPPVVMVDDEFVRVHFGGDVHAALGRRLRFKADNEPWGEIVGVVRHVTHYGLEEHARAEVYQLWLQMSPGPSVNFHYLRAMDFAVKTAGEPMSYLPAIRAELRKIDNDLPIGNVATLEKLLRDSSATRRFNLGLISAFALIALALSAVGLYGVMSYGVNHRTTEIGIRMAVRAAPQK